MLIGREEERARIDRLLESARSGRSGSLLLVGDPGIGKTALLDHVAAQATDMRVLRARGMESESDLLFAGLAELLAPLLPLLDEIPPPQATALRSVLALGPPSPHDRFAAYAGVLSVLAAAADGAPVVAMVDDASWLDSASWEALRFVARRLEVEGVVLLLAARADEPGVDEDPTMPVLRLAGLDVETARPLVARTGSAPPEEVVRHLVAATGGNPLAILEASTILTPGQLAGLEPVPDPLPVGEVVTAAFRRRVDRLPDDSRRALLVAAASHRGAMGEIGAALTSMGLNPAALDRAEDAGLVKVADGRLAFSHPLIRSAVYRSAGGPARREAHRALAEAAAPEERAWHLAEAATGPDEETARALEEVAAGVRERGGYGSSAEALRRAALLSPEPGPRAMRRLAAAEGFHLSGRPKTALALLDEALADAEDPLLRADIQQLRGVAHMWSGGLLEAQRLTLDEALRIETLDPARAAMMLTTAVTTHAMAGEVESAWKTGRQAMEVAERVGGAMRTGAAMAYALALLLRGESAAGRELLTEAVGGMETMTSPIESLQNALLAGTMLVIDEQHERAGRLLDGMVAMARAMSAPSALPITLATRSDLQFRLGRWAAARADASEALRLAEETGQVTEVPHAMVILARLEAAEGRAEDCRLHARRAQERIAALGVGSLRTYVGAAVGLLELGLGRTDEAIAELAATHEVAQDHGLRDPSIVPYLPDLVEAYVRGGRIEEARPVLDLLEERARRTERAASLAAAARCRGLVEDREFGGAFEEALRWHERAGMPFEQARTELCYAERLRRARSRTEARDRAAAALRTFERLGAEPWAERARAELRAGGGTARRREAVGLGSLTPQEVQVAMVVGEGATNREAAAALFLSPKTIDFHLGNVYRKLGIRSRAELARQVAMESAAPGMAAADSG
jgi:DNA-binding CsgD family transcriptional regulator